jgi:hypothetical protein
LDAGNHDMSKIYARACLLWTLWYVIFDRWLPYLVMGLEKATVDSFTPNGISIQIPFKTSIPIGAPRRIFHSSIHGRRHSTPNRIQIIVCVIIPSSPFTETPRHYDAAIPPP